REKFRQGQFQSAIRSIGARTGSTREFVKEDRYAVLSKTWRNSEKTSHLVPSQRCYADLQRRRHRLRARLHHARIRRSLFDHVSPPSAYSRAQRRADQTLGAEKSHRQSTTPSSSKNGEHPASRRSLYQPYSDALQPRHDRLPRETGESV